jgi:hypothetical protein
VWFQYEALFDENLKRVLDTKRYTGRREMAALPIGKTLRERGATVDFSSPLTFKTSRALFDAPLVEKTIVEVEVALRLKEGRRLEASAEFQVAYQGAPPAAVSTDVTGIVATAPDHPAGTGLPALAAMTQGKSVEGSWTISSLTNVSWGWVANCDSLCAPAPSRLDHVTLNVRCSRLNRGHASSVPPRHNAHGRPAQAVESR